MPQIAHLDDTELKKTLAFPPRNPSLEDPLPLTAFPSTMVSSQPHYVSLIAPFHRMTEMVQSHTPVATGSHS